MQDTQPTFLWQQADWLTQVHNWIRQSLSHQAITITGEIEQPHIRPWATVMRIPTDSGNVYFKATTKNLSHETGLTQFLAQGWPDYVPGVLAADRERLWLLMRDAGATLRVSMPTVDDLSWLDDAIPLYVKLQREVSQHQETLRKLGLPDRRMSQFAAAYEKLLKDQDAMMISTEDGLSEADYARLQSLVPAVAAMCKQLEDSGIPDSIQHDDFHDANIFVRDGRIIFADWGDSCLSHPFMSIMVMLRSLAYRLKLEADAPELLHVRDLYLDQWLDYGTREQLLEIFSITQKLGTISRSMTWYNTLKDLPDEQRAEDADAVPGWLLEFLDALDSAK